MSKTLSINDRIDTAEIEFKRKFGHMDDEWTETFDLACRFACRLSDTPDRELQEKVVAWIELAAKCEE